MISRERSTHGSGHAAHKDGKASPFLSLLLYPSRFYQQSTPSSSSQTETEKCLRPCPLSTIHTHKGQLHSQHPDL